ncbi:PepSY-like domain-containing protein [Spirosoma sp.]|uniref:PepSY-like domain-containing protein n=1 Tax=Spirosoma sp. TaxID=1899569 RepID=UPI001ACB9970|nr:PepSY-like domain-containing protein [Spirosoma sp.]MBN8826598.1 PepSY-like domain-containing protein [Spirosoma sp.]
MKHLLLALTTALLLTGIIAACTQSNVDPTSSTLANARIASVTSSSAVSGTCVKGSSETVVSASSLPAAVLTYLSTTYPGYTLVQAEQGTNLNGGATYYEVKFTYNGATKELHFDMTGAVVAESGRGKGKDKGGSGGNSEVVITADKLPAAALTYLSTNFSGYTLVQAEQGTNSSGATYYEVKFTYNGKTKEIHFDANGALL